MPTGWMFDTVRQDKGMTQAGALKALESMLNLETHEAVHAVLWRAWGADVEIVDDESGPVTNPVCHRPVPLEWHVTALMGPEVYMTLNGIAFTAFSVCDDREKIDELLNNRADEKKFRGNIRENLIVIFKCRYIQKAIKLLAQRAYSDNPGSIKSLSKNDISETIDSTLIRSIHSAGLREHLKLCSSPAPRSKGKRR